MKNKLEERLEKKLSKSPESINEGTVSVVNINFRKSKERFVSDVDLNLIKTILLQSTNAAGYSDWEKRVNSLDKRSYISLLDRMISSVLGKSAIISTIVKK